MKNSQQLGYYVFSVIADGKPIISCFYSSRGWQLQYISVDHGLCSQCTFPFLQSSYYDTKVESQLE